MCVYKCVGDKIMKQAIFKQQPIEGIYNNNNDNKNSGSEKKVINEIYWPDLP